MMMRSKHATSRFNAPSNCASSQSCNSTHISPSKPCLRPPTYITASNVTDQHWLESNLAIITFSHVKHYEGVFHVCRCREGRGGTEHTCQPPEYKNLETFRNLCIVRMSFSTMSEYSPKITLLNVPDVSRLPTMYCAI